MRVDKKEAVACLDLLQQLAGQTKDYLTHSVTTPDIDIGAIGVDGPYAPGLIRKPCGAPTPDHSHKLLAAHAVMWCKMHGLRP